MNPEVEAQIREIGEKTGMTAEQVERLANALLDFKADLAAGPITYTNRAARRARARAERKRP